MMIVTVTILAILGQAMCEDPPKGALIHLEETVDGFAKTCLVADENDVAVLVPIEDDDDIWDNCQLWTVSVTDDKAKILIAGKEGEGLFIDTDAGEVKIGAAAEAMLASDGVWGDTNIVTKFANGEIEADIALPGKIGRFAYSCIQLGDELGESGVYEVDRYAASSPCTAALTSWKFEINPCTPNPCQNNGECTAEGFDYSCKCPPSYCGADCDVECTQGCLITKFHHCPQEVDDGHELRCKKGRCRQVEIGSQSDGYSEVVCIGKDEIEQKCKEPKRCNKNGNWRRRRRCRQTCHADIQTCSQ